MIQFNHFNFNVVDLDRSLTFYRDALGLEPVRRKTAPDGSFQLVYLGDGGTGERSPMTWGSVSSTWPLSQTSMTPSMPGIRRWAACALKIPPWGSISSPIRTATGSRSCR